MYNNWWSDFFTKYLLYKTIFACNFYMSTFLFYLYHYDTPCSTYVALNSHKKWSEVYKRFSIVQNMKDFADWSHKHILHLKQYHMHIFQHNMIAPEN